MQHIYVGTSGYDYPEWKGVFYPEKLARKDFLSFYAEKFNALEINYTYYRPPSAVQLASMIERTEGRVKFSLKGNRTFTHEVKGDWKQYVAEFRSALSPLTDKNLLLSVLLQFPQRFHYQEEERRYLSDLLQEFTGIPVVVEFRHSSWDNSRLINGLEKRGVGYCLCDMPHLDKLPFFKPVSTASSVYLRFHGRNEENWYKGDSRSRYDYLYSEDQLKAYVPVLKEGFGSVKLVQVYFNNHAKGQAVVNARRLKLLLGL